MNNHRRGLFLTIAGGIALSFDVPLVRLGGGELWQTLALRSLSTFALGVLIWALLSRLQPGNPVLRPGKAGLLAGLFYGFSTITFLGAVFNTTTANVVFIVAFTPMFAALFGWVLLREQLSRSTWITMIAMILGVGIIVSGGLSGGELLGNMLALATTLLLAGAITIGRKTRVDLGLVPLAATIIPAVFGLAMMQPGGLMSVPSPFWILLDGLVMLPVAFWCLATGPKYLTGAEVGMCYLLETVLAPIWVWMIFAEEMEARTMLGGAILILSLISHALWQMRRGNQRLGLS
ncbi:DMT family transporter [Rhizobium wenxiniae]|uniref:Drug/metabolite transporter (DMT)-like permease n=1 Tax=Rhizobium wenxiniae TaxID=1737357 RepID=A0A7X0CZI1_9HYPH|nr:DMT family transporter [Rhizobium wenxiniae]MBB6162013.1 drug/metabolite transporter (DMT)-like permease [Rhizobium wenxiniae]GGF78210.1 membrane protein [Rhizobium wenxiniae]